LPADIGIEWQPSPGCAGGFYAGLIELIRSHARESVWITSGKRKRLRGVLPGQAEPGRKRRLPTESPFAPQPMLSALRMFSAAGCPMGGAVVGRGRFVVAARGESAGQSPQSYYPGPTARRALLAGLLWAFEQSLPVEEVARWGWLRHRHCHAARHRRGSRSEVEKFLNSPA